MSSNKRPDSKKASSNLSTNAYARAKYGLDETDTDLFSHAVRPAEAQTKPQTPLEPKREVQVVLDANNPYLTDRDVARRYKVSKQTVWRWSGEDLGFPKPCKFLGATRWVRKELDEFDQSVMGARL